MSDPICTPPGSNAPRLSAIYADVLKPTFDLETFKPFLCEVMKMAGVDDIDPILYSVGELDYSQYTTNFDALTSIGDPRISLGSVLKAGFDYFFPLALAQVEVIRSGGCKIVDGYICDSQGNRKKSTITQCPANFSMEPITAEDVKNYTLNLIQSAFLDHAQRFVNYINYMQTLGWTPSLFVYDRFPMFYVKLSNGAGAIYLKYYQDTKEIVSGKLGLPITLRTDLLFDSPEHSDAMVSPIPNY